MQPRSTDEHHQGNPRQQLGRNSSLSIKMKFDIIYIMRNKGWAWELADVRCVESALFIAQQRQKQCATEALSIMQLPRKAVKAGTIFGNALIAVQKSPAKL